MASRNCSLVQQRKLMLSAPLRQIAVQNGRVTLCAPIYHSPMSRLMRWPMWWLRVDFCGYM